MIHLGPVSGRTKTTEDHKPVSPTVVAVREIKNLRLKLALLRWAIICTVGGFLGWVGFGALAQHMGQAEEERQTRACAVAMAAKEHLDGPVGPCEHLTPAQRRSAAYEYGHMKGLW